MCEICETYHSYVVLNTDYTVLRKFSDKAVFQW